MKLLPVRRFCLLLPLLVAPVALTLAQTTPRQLNTLPTVSDSVQPAATHQPAPAPAAAPPIEASRYSVGLKNGQTYRVFDVETKQPVFGRSFLLLDGQQRIDLSEVKYYEDETGHYVRTKLPKGNRDVTLRREKVGRISQYSAYTNQFSGGYPGGFSPYGYGGRYGGFGGYGMGGPMYRPIKVEYFTKDNGPVQDLSLKNLSLATADNPASTEMLLQARRYQQYATASYVVGGGLLVAGLLNSLSTRDGGTLISPLMYAAVPFLIVPVVVQGKQQRSIRQAISLYNRGPQ
ncbi:hypothetical protein [Hymenobacter algoricola]|uniref:DUF4178 domain-containing protein n=1 Tax=Hymenobacter algoricola TaxID=486267 RepID=A0ABP7MRV3_9BACT